jgi:hypothetical protein
MNLCKYINQSVLEEINTRMEGIKQVQQQE